MNVTHQIVLFDAMCKLCSGWAKFLIRYDVKHRYKLASVQSAQGQKILTRCGLPTDSFHTLVFVDGEKVHIRSSAVIKILMGLGFPWVVAGILWIIPRPIRDWLYDRIALNRYTLFGKYESCVLPSADHEGRFLDD